MLSPQLDLYKNMSPYLKDMSVLEVGSGTGFGSIQIGRYAEYYVGVDTDDDAVEFADECLATEKSTFFTADICDMDTMLNITGYEHLDAVVMVETLEHIKDYRLALSNIHKLLKPGGRLFMTARNANADLRRNDFHEREWTAQQLYDNLSEFFDTKIYNYKFEIQSPSTRITPLIAIATKYGTIPNYTYTNSTSSSIRFITTPLYSFGSYPGPRWVEGHSKQELEGDLRTDSVIPHP